ILQLVPNCPRPDKFLLWTRPCRGHSEQCPTTYRRFLAQPGIAEASRKSLRPRLAIQCCVDRAQGSAPSRQRFHPSVLVVVRLGREHQGHRCCPAKAPGRGVRASNGKHRRYASEASESLVGLSARARCAPPVSLACNASAIALAISRSTPKMSVSLRSKVSYHRCESLATWMSRTLTRT